MEENPQYGWYVKKLIIIFLIFGFNGLVLFVLGFYFQGWISIFMLIVGLCLILLFFWPGIGFSAINLSLGEESIVTKKISTIKDIAPKEYLDVGCGTGRHSIQIAKILSSGAHLTGIDIYNVNAISGNSLQTVQNNARIEGISQKTTFQVGSAMDIPFEDSKFDVINISSVLHEIHKYIDQKKVLNEMYRVLKPEGYLFVGEWNRKALQTIAFMGIFCFVFKPKNYWHNLLRQTGFEDITYNQLSGFGLFIARKPRI